MCERHDPPAALLARKGEARPAANPVNDNRPAPSSPPAIGPACASLSAAMLASAATLAGGRQAAVTLRLDPRSHMRLRLACAVSGRSAETIIGEALDAHLKAMPGVEGLVAEALAASGGDAVTGWDVKR